MGRQLAVPSLRSLRDALQELLWVELPFAWSAEMVGLQVDRTNDCLEDGAPVACSCSPSSKKAVRAGRFSLCLPDSKA